MRRTPRPWRSAVAGALRARFRSALVAGELSPRSTDRGGKPRRCGVRSPLDAERDRSHLTLVAAAADPTLALRRWRALDGDTGHADPLHSAHEAPRLRRNIGLQLPDGQGKFVTGGRDPPVVDAPLAGTTRGYELFVSEVVLRECRAGDTAAVTRRLEAIGETPLLGVTDQIAAIARLLLSEGIMPANAAEDALHISIAAVHRVDFLLSWNFKHIANPVMQARIAARLSHLGLDLPFICAPEELAGGDDE